MTNRLAAWMVLCSGWLFLPLIASVTSAAEPAWQPKPGEVIVFVGDGNTQAAQFTQYLENFLLTRYPGQDFRLVNAGVDGQRVTDVLERFSADMARHQPTTVVVWLGETDAARQPLRDDLFQAYRHDLSELDGKIRELGATPIYLSPPIFDFKAARQHLPKPEIEGLELLNATLAYYGVWLREFAGDRTAPFVDLHGPFTQLTREGRAINSEFTFFPEGEYLGQAGQLVVAASFLEQLGLAHPLSAIQISQQGEMVTAAADGGQVLNLQVVGNQSLSFLWLAEALPWSIPAETSPAGSLLHLGDAFNRETLQVRGLAPGNYELLIENRLLGRFSHEALADGVALQNLPTPQALQAAQITDANRQRHQDLGAIWNLVQERQRLLRKLAAHPDEIELKPQLAKLEAKLSAAREPAPDRQQDSETEWARLHELSQPVPRQFVIRPLQSAEVRGRVLVGGMPIPGAQVELHGIGGLTAVGTTDAMGGFDLAAQAPDGIPAGEAWLVVLAKMVLPKFVSLEKNGHRVTLRSGVNEIELHFEESAGGQ